MKVSDVIEIMEEIAPLWMANPGDPNGLHAGNPSAKISKVLLALDASMDVIDYAARKKYQMIVTHHPRFYKGLKNLDETTFDGKLAAKIIRAGISVYCAHTNLDTAPGGVNDALAEVAGIFDPQPLLNTVNDDLLKLTVYVPESHVEQVREAICEMGPGLIGDYSDCTFRTGGVGTFRGMEGTKPYIGTPGKLEEVLEYRLEVLLEKSRKREVLAAMIAAHPYEEPAYDLFELDNAVAYSCGRIGKLKKSVTLKTLARKLKKSCATPSVLVSGKDSKKISNVAVWSGACAPVSRVISLKPDVLVTGELGHHEIELLEAAKIAVIILGHAPSEEVVFPTLRESLENALEGVTVDIYPGGLPRMWTA